MITPLSITVFAALRIFAIIDCQLTLPPMFFFILHCYAAAIFAFAFHFIFRYFLSLLILFSLQLFIIFAIIFHYAFADAIDRFLSFHFTVF